MEENCLKERLCMERAMSTIDKWVEENSELTENLARIIELKEQGMVHQAMQVLCKSLALFCSGLIVKSLFNSEPDECYNAVFGACASSIFTTVSGHFKSRASREKECTLEEVKEDFLSLMNGKYNIGISVLTADEQEIFLNMFIAKILKDKAIVNKIKKLSRQDWTSINNDSEM